MVWWCHVDVVTCSSGMHRPAAMPCDEMQHVRCRVMKYNMCDGVVLECGKQITNDRRGLLQCNVAKLVTTITQYSFVFCSVFAGVSVTLSIVFSLSGADLLILMPNDTHIKLLRLTLA
jgi:hypothetical protein